MATQLIGSGGGLLCKKGGAACRNTSVTRCGTRQGWGWELALDQYSGKGELLTLGDPDQNTYPVNDNDLYFIREEGQNAIRLVLRPYQQLQQCKFISFSHRFCKLGVQRNFVKQIKSIMQAMSYELLEQIRKKYAQNSKLYFCLGQKGTKHAGHIRKYTFEGSN